MLILFKLIYGFNTIVETSPCCFLLIDKWVIKSTRECKVSRITKAILKKRTQRCRSFTIIVQEISTNYDSENHVKLHYLDMPLHIYWGKSDLFKKFIKLYARKWTLTSPLYHNAKSNYRLKAKLKENNQFSRM